MSKPDTRNLKVAVVYDWMDRWGGVERILLTFHEMFPRAHFYTSVYDEKRAPWAAGMRVTPSFMQRMPRFIRESRILSLLFYPFAFESFELAGYDLVLSVSSSFAKGVVTKPETFHLCYLLTPSRYLWLYKHPASGKIPGPFLRSYESYMKRWDRQASRRPDTMVTLSHTVAARCKNIYGRDAEVVYPPFDASYWSRMTMEEPDGVKQFTEGVAPYLVVSRLEPYKKVGLVVEAFRDHPGKKLIIVGTGSCLPELKRKATDNVLFLEKVTEGELKWLYSRSNALIMPQIEDFGYVSIEAQFFGLPVIAFRGGGALETVQDGKTGLFFPEQSSASLSSAIERYDKISYNFKHGMKELGQSQAKKYAKETFVARINEIIISSLRK